MACEALLLARAAVCCSAPQTHLQLVLTPALLASMSKHGLAKERGKMLNSRHRNPARKKNDKKTNKQKKEIKERRKQING